MSPSTTTPINPSPPASSPGPGPSIPFPRQQSYSAQRRPEYYMSLSDVDDDPREVVGPGGGKAGRPRLSSGTGGGRRFTTSLTTPGTRVDAGHQSQQQQREREQHRQHQLVRTPSRQDAYRREKERAIAATSNQAHPQSQGRERERSNSLGPPNSPGLTVSSGGAAGSGSSGSARASPRRSKPSELLPLRTEGVGDGYSGSGNRAGGQASMLGYGQGQSIDPAPTSAGRRQTYLQPRQDLSRYPSQQQPQSHAHSQSSSLVPRGQQQTVFTSLIPPTPGESPSGSRPGSPSGSPSTYPSLITNTNSKPNSKSNPNAKHFYFPSFASQTFGMGISFPFPSYGGGNGGDVTVAGGSGDEPSGADSGSAMARSTSADVERGGNAKSGIMTRSHSGTGIAGLISSAYDSIEGRFSSAAGGSGGGSGNIRPGSPTTRLAPKAFSYGGHDGGGFGALGEGERERDESVDWDMGRPVRPYRHSFQALAYAAQDPTDGGDIVRVGGGIGAGVMHVAQHRGKGTGSNSASPTRRDRVRSQDAHMNGGTGGSPGRPVGLRLSTHIGSAGLQPNARGSTKRAHSASGSDGEVDWHRPPRQYRESQTSRSPQSSRHLNQNRVQQPFSPYGQAGMGEGSAARRSFDALSATLDYDNARRQDDLDTVVLTDPERVSRLGRRSSIGGHVTSEAMVASGYPYGGRDKLLQIPTFSGGASSSSRESTRTGSTHEVTKMRPGLHLTRSYTMDSMALSRTVSPQPAPPTAPPPLSRLPTSRSARDISLNEMTRADSQRRADARETPPARSAASRGLGPPRVAIAARDGEPAHRDRGLEAKVVLLGSTNVGKTSLAKRHAEGTFDMRTSAVTINTSLFTSKASYQGVEVRLQLWDTAGEERHRSLTKLYYRGAHAALIVYDITDSKSFADVQGWLRELKSSVSDGQEPLIFVIGSKADLSRGQRQVDRRFAREQVASWLGLSSVPDRSPGGFGDSGFSTSGIDHDLTGRSPPLDPPSLRIVEPTSATERSQPASFIKPRPPIPTPSENAMETDKSQAIRAQPFRFLSMLSSASRPASEHTISRPPSIHPNIAASRRALTGARSQSVSAATALMVMNPKATSKALAQASGGGSQQVIKSPTERDRRKSEDWGGRLKAAQAAVVLETTPSLGQPMPIAKPNNRKSLELFEPQDRASHQESRSQEPDDIDGWGKLITGTNVRVGEVSARSGKGVHELFLTINTQLVSRRDRITRERLRRERESVYLTEGEGSAQHAGSAKVKAAGSCCGV